MPNDKVRKESKRHWEGVAKSTEPIQDEHAKLWVEHLYEMMKLPKPREIFVVESPKRALALLKELRDGYEKEGEHKWAFVQKNVKEKLSEYLNKEMREKLARNSEYKQRDDAAQQIWANLSQQFSGFGDAIERGLENPDGEEFVSTTHNIGIGAFLDHMIGSVGDKAVEHLLPFVNFCRSAGWTLLFDGIAIISDRPRELHFDEEHRLHNPTGPAVRYEDGFERYSVNGMSLKKGYVVKEGKDLDPQLILKEGNIDVRRYLVEKIGLDRLLKTVPSKLIDRYKSYELIMVKMNGMDCYYLKMQNPSIDAVHFEGVDPSCRTVKAALEWRNGTKGMPKILT
jgi:hypothetical protein